MDAKNYTYENYNLEANMLPIPAALMDESESKLYVLFSLNELGSCTHMQLLHFMVENAIMTYFDLSLALGALVKEELTVQRPHPADHLYEITSSGKKTLEFFSDRLPYSKKKLIVSQAPMWKKRFTREKQFVGKVTQNSSGEYVARLSLMDGDDSLLSIDIPAPDRTLADRMAHTWPETAGFLYEMLLNTLCKEPDAK